MEVRRHSGDTARKNLAALGDELFQEIGIFVIDRLDRDVDATARHGAVGAAEGGAAFGCFRFHGLFGFPVQRVTAQKRVVFLFLQAARSIRAFFVAGRNVSRRRFALGFRLGAFECDVVSGHNVF